MVNIPEAAGPTWPQQPNRSSVEYISGVRLPLELIQTRNSSTWREPHNQTLACEIIIIRIYSPSLPPPPSISLLVGFCSHLLASMYISMSLLLYVDLRASRNPTRSVGCSTRMCVLAGVDDDDDDDGANSSCRTYSGLRPKRLIGVKAQFIQSVESYAWEGARASTLHTTYTTTTILLCRNLKGIQRMSEEQHSNDLCR